jgi:regulator of protease activity HflC (stomatin/prohibitin superfamily)
MIETLTVITLCVLFLVFFRPGKTPPLDNPLVIERPGKYKMTLAPKLNLAQPFIEAISGRMDKLNISVQQGNAVRCFAVNDKQVAANKSDVYLLAIIVRQGMLYFLAEQPKSDSPGNYLETIKSAAKDLLTDIADTDEGSRRLGENIVDAVQQVSQERGIAVDVLSV